MFPVRTIITIILMFLFLIGTLSHSQTERNALAILNLRPTNMEAMGYDGEILYALISALEKKDLIGLMPRREMEDILFQAGLVQGDSLEMALEIGKVLGINFVLFGRVTKKVGRIETNVSLLDVQYGRVIKSWVQMFSGREDILARIPSFAEELSDAILNGVHLAIPSAASAVQEMQFQVRNRESQGKNQGGDKLKRPFEMF